jgi:diguanylate cyclase (GGDEF)-like protein/PAS domain S-box-containing protein
MQAPFDNPAVLLAIIRHMMEGILVVDEAGVIRATNPSLDHMLGYEPGELLGQPLDIIIPPEYAERHRQHLEHFHAAGEAHIMGKGREVAGFHKDGHQVPMEVGISQVQGEPGYYLIGVVRDISERKKAEQELQFMAMHDMLTGLSNRMSLRIQLHKAIIDAKRYPDRRFALLYCDLVRFKQANDRMGHQAGDVILKVVAERLRRSVRESDMVARLGGDEFVILAQEPSEESATKLAQRIIKAVEAPLEINSKRITVGISIGVAFYPEDGQEASILLNHADQAMYQTKGTGASAFKFFRELPPGTVAKKGP